MQLASTLLSAATSDSSSPSGSMGRFVGGFVTLIGARGVVSASGCRLAEVSMVMLLALFESSGAGVRAETGALARVATGAGLLTVTAAGAFARAVATGAGAEAATTGVARGAVTAATLTGAGCGAGAGCGGLDGAAALYAAGVGAGAAMSSATTDEPAPEAGLEVFAITAVAAGVGCG